MTQTDGSRYEILSKTCLLVVTYNTFYDTHPYVGHRSETNEIAKKTHSCGCDVARDINRDGHTKRLNGQHLSFRFKWKLILLCFRNLMGPVSFHPLCVCRIYWVVFLSLISLLLASNLFFRYGCLCCCHKVETLFNGIQILLFLGSAQNTIS